ncbi:MAG: hypothetical protein ACREIH_03960 [Nitrospiraceae bacterium]
MRLIPSCFASYTLHYSTESRGDFDRLAEWGQENPTLPAQGMVSSPRLLKFVVEKFSLAPRGSPEK